MKISKYFIKFISIALFFLLMPASLKSQEKTTVKGRCISEENTPISNVEIYKHDTVLISTSDKSGRFIVYNVEVGDTLFFSHLALEEKIHIIENEDFTTSITVKFKISSIMLPDAEIVSSAPHVVYNNKVVSVVDYEINDKGVYLIAWRQNGYSLLHLSFEMDTLSELNIPKKYDNLYKDIFGEIHIISNSFCYQIGHKKRRNRYLKMEMLYGMTTPIFYQLMGNTAAATDSIIVTGNYFFYNKELYYYKYKVGGDKEPTLIRHIVDVVGRDDIILIKKTGRPPMNYAELFCKPIYDPMFQIDNELYLFSFDEDKFFKYDVNGDEIAESPLTIHKYKHWSGKLRDYKDWQKKVLMDPAKSDFYGIFVRDGITTIKRIDLETGMADKIAKIGGYPHLQNLKIYNGDAYFLYSTDKDGHRYKLYKVKLGE